MSEPATWVKLYRNIDKWGWYKDLVTKSVFIHLLLFANYRDSEFEGKIIKRGQIVTGRKKLCKELGISEQQLRTALEHLKKTKEISTAPTNKYTIITINNYDKFQSAEPYNSSQTEEEQPVTTSQPTKNQPTANQKPTNKKTEINQELTENQPATNHQPTNSQPAIKQKPTNKKPPIKQKSTNKKPPINQEPTQNQPVISQELTNNQPTADQQQSKSQPTTNQQPTKNQPAIKQNPTNSQPTANQQSTNNQPHLNKLINKEINNSISQEVVPPAPPQTPPLLEDIISFCNKQNYEIDCYKFYSHYSLYGWKYKGKPIDWKQQARIWNENERRPQRYGRVELKTPPSYDLEEYENYTIDSWFKEKTPSETTGQWS